jgi:hypothetical protein
VEFAGVSAALGQPPEHGPRRREVSEHQGGAELQQRHRNDLLRPGGKIAERRACLLQLGQPGRPLTTVEHRGSVDRPQCEMQTGRRGRDVERQARRCQPLGVVGLRSHQRCVRERGRGGGEPHGSLPAVLCGGCNGLAARGPHRPHIATDRRDDTPEREALHHQVVESVPPAQNERTLELLARRDAISPFEASEPPADARESLELGFDG